MGQTAVNKQNQRLAKYQEVRYVLVHIKISFNVKLESDFSLRLATAGTCR